MDEILENLLKSCLDLAKEFLDKESLTDKETEFLRNIDLFINKL